eukprot:g1434.t1
MKREREDIERAWQRKLDEEVKRAIVKTKADMETKRDFIHVMIHLSANMYVVPVLSHFQATGGDQVGMLQLELKMLGDISRVLITSRLRDVVPDALTVDLSVLSKEEAAQLLMRTACLGDVPAESRPVAVDEITRQCGLLPLGIVLAGKVIASYGQGWETEVIELLRDSHSEQLRRQTHHEGQLTVEQHVIETSLQAIRGPQAADVVELFQLMAAFPEDVIIPIVIIIALVESQQTRISEVLDGERRRTHMKIRERVNILLGRSLLLGNLHEGIKVHDLILAELREAHFRFAGFLIATTPFQPTNLKSPTRGAEVHWYKSHHLVYHVQASLHADASAGGVALRNEPNAVLCWIDAEQQTRRLICEGFGVRRMEEHAKWLDGQGQYEGAGCWFHEMSALYLRQESVTRERKQVVGKNAEILKCALAACQRAATTTQTNMRQISIYLGLAGSWGDDRAANLAKAKMLFDDIDVDQIDTDGYTEIGCTLNMCNALVVGLSADVINERIRQLKLISDRVAGSLSTLSTTAQCAYMDTLSVPPACFYGAMASRRTEIDMATLREILAPPIFDEIYSTYELAQHHATCKERNSGMDFILQFFPWGFLLHNNLSLVHKHSRHIMQCMAEAHEIHVGRNPNSADMNCLMCMWCNAPGLMMVGLAEEWRRFLESADLATVVMQQLLDMQRAYVKGEQMAWFVGPGE